MSSNKYTLTLLDATGIQEYIFASNQLAQNIGASELVERVTTEWFVNTLDSVVGRENHNAEWSLTNGLEVQPGRDGRAVEVIYAGGGNAAVLFAKDEDAKECIQQLSRLVLQRARGLQFIAVRKRFDWSNDPPLSAVLSGLRRQAFQRKSNRPISMPMPGLAITAPCVFTGLPAVGYNTDPALVGPEAAKRMSELDEQRLISKEVADKLRAEPDGKERLHAILEQVRKSGLQFVYDFDQFGERGESSYIAVVHADVTGMGKRFEALADKYPTSKQNREYLEALRKLSDETRRRARKALTATVDALLKAIRGDAQLKKRIVPVRRGQEYLPFRPIIFGGDDLTFVADGRLGLDLAARYLREFTKEVLDGAPVYARAGVAVVKTHFPFSRAYDLAEDLAEGARRPDATMLDWHFSTTGVIRTLHDIREQDYQAHVDRPTQTRKSLLMRPVRVAPLPAPRGEWRTWATFTKLVNQFNDDPWAGKRNKIKDLQTALRGGPKQVELFRENYRIKEEEMPPIDGLDFQKMGWQGDSCGYFDALEAQDFFIGLEPK